MSPRSAIELLEVVEHQRLGPTPGQHSLDRQGRVEGACQGIAHRPVVPTGLQVAPDLRPQSSSQPRLSHAPGSEQQHDPRGPTQLGEQLAPPDEILVLRLEDEPVADPVDAREAGGIAQLPAQPGHCVIQGAGLDSCPVPEGLCEQHRSLHRPASGLAEQLEDRYLLGAESEDLLTASDLAKVHLYEGQADAKHAHGSPRHSSRKATSRSDKGRRPS